MYRLDRLFALMLVLRSGQRVSAGDLAERLDVSIRTIHRDLGTLGASGVPIYTQRGRGGGIRLVEGYFLPPLMLSPGEGIALLLGLSLLRRMRARPFPAEAETGAQKLLAAVPERLRAVLADLERVLGIESLPEDVFHPETYDTPMPGHPKELSARESEALTIFLQALLDGQVVRMRYRSPYRSEATEVEAHPLGIFWDRDRWYLVGKKEGTEEAWRLWRADRVRHMLPSTRAARSGAGFDIRSFAGRTWLHGAMEAWLEQSPVEIHMTAKQAEVLRRDWYYGHARFEPLASGRVSMRYGESDPAVALALLRWLGPGAELVSPDAWREFVCQDLRAMLEEYS